MKFICTLILTLLCTAALAQEEPTSTLTMTTQITPAVTQEKKQDQGQDPDPIANFAPQTPVPNPAAEQGTPAAFVTEPSTTEGDLWDRIRRGFAMPDLQDEFVINREQWYATRPDYIARMTERSKKYLHHIVEELEARKMPTELALLPFIESAFNPQAVSSAKAAGMWQFIPSTGRDYALKQNIFRDDRRDVQASTRAALDYLQKLYGMFGDWHLALAAYNWGEGSVSRAMAKNQKMGLPTDYPSLKMPNETRYYVPKLQAVKNITLNPAKFNVQLEAIPNHPYFQSVAVARDMDVAIAAKLAQVPLADFKALNPSLSRPVILAAGTPRVLMPWGNAEIFIANLAQFKEPLASWTAWMIPTSLKPSDAAKRVGMSETLLREVNGITKNAGIIKAGSTLLIPRAAHKTDNVTAQIADNGHLTMFTPVVAKKCTTTKNKNGKVVTTCLYAKAKSSTAQPKKKNAKK